MKNKRIFLFVCLFCLCISAKAGEKSNIETVSEKLISEVDFSTFLKDSWQVSPDNKRLVYVESTATEFFVVLDGKKEGPYARLNKPVFSADSRRVAYPAMIGNECFVIADGSKIKAYNGVGSNLTFSADGKRLAFAANAGGKWLVIADEKVQKKYDAILADTVKFSPDGKKVAYAACEGDKTFAVLDGKEGKKYDGIGSSFFFSSDGKKLVYNARVGKKWFIVAGGREGKQYDAIVKGSLTFSPDGKRMAYAARESDKRFVVIDGKELEKYDRISCGPVFSPDSKRLAYAVLEGNHEGKKSFVVVDGKKGKEYDGIGSGTLIFSPDGKRVAYAARVGEDWFVVVDGKEEKKYKGIGKGTPIFSPDGKHVAYTAVKRAGFMPQLVVVRDGKEGATRQDILEGTLTFSPDSKHLAYAVRIIIFPKPKPNLEQEWFIVIDEKKGKSYTYIIAKGGGRLVFDGPDTLSYFAATGSKIYLVKNKISKASGKPIERKKKKTYDYETCRLIVKRDFRVIEDSITLYKLHTGRYPQKMENLLDQPPDMKSWKGPYLAGGKLPRDPWDEPYIYTTDSVVGSDAYNLISYGADRQEGGTGENRDLVNVDFKNK